MAPEGGHARGAAAPGTRPGQCPAWQRRRQERPAMPKTGMCLPLLIPAPAPHATSGENAQTSPDGADRSKPRDSGIMHAVPCRITLVSHRKATSPTVRVMIPPVLVPVPLPPPIHPLHSGDAHAPRIRTHARSGRARARRERHLCGTPGVLCGPELCRPCGRNGGQRPRSAVLLHEAVQLAGAGEQWQGGAGSLSSTAMPWDGT